MVDVEGRGLVVCEGRERKRKRDREPVRGRERRRVPVLRE